MFTETLRSPAWKLIVSLSLSLGSHTIGKLSKLPNGGMSGAASFPFYEIRKYDVGGHLRGRLVRGTTIGRQDSCSSAAAVRQSGRHRPPVSGSAPLGLVIGGLWPINVAAVKLT